MRVLCYTYIDNPEDRDYFIRKVKCLDVKVDVNGSIVKAEYTGYNQGLIEVLLRTYEEQPRSTIRLFTH